jgi:hypothetical protein
MISLAGHERSKFAFVKVFHVKWFCTLVGQTLFCCNKSGHENELPLGFVGAALRYAISSMLFMLEAEGDPIGASENMGLPITGLQQSVPWKSSWRAHQRCACDIVGVPIGMSCHFLWNNFWVLLMLHFPFFVALAWIRVILTLGRFHQMLSTIQRLTWISLRLA